MIDIETDRYSAWLAALADPTRRRIVELLGQAPHTATELHRAFPIAGPAVSRHLRVLREAGLVTEHRVPADGRLRLYVLETEPLRRLSSWLDGLGQSWQDRLADFQDYVAVRAERPR